MTADQALDKVISNLQYSIKSHDQVKLQTKFEILDHSLYGIKYLMDSIYYFDEASMHTVQNEVESKLEEVWGDGAYRDRSDLEIQIYNDSKRLLELAWLLKSDMDKTSRSKLRIAKKPSIGKKIFIRLKKNQSQVFILMLLVTITLFIPEINDPTRLEKIFTASSLLRFAPITVALLLGLMKGSGTDSMEWQSIHALLDKLETIKISYKSVVYTTIFNRTDNNLFQAHGYIDRSEITSFSLSGIGLSDWSINCESIVAGKAIFISQGIINKLLALKANVSDRSLPANIKMSLEKLVNIERPNWDSDYEYYDQTFMLLFDDSTEHSNAFHKQDNNKQYVRIAKTKINNKNIVEIRSFVQNVRNLHQEIVNYYITADTKLPSSY